MIARRIITKLLLCYALTVILEALTALPAGVRDKHGQFIIFVANTITNPFMNCLLLIVSFYLSPDLYYFFLIPFEIIVVAAEGFIYKKNISVRIDPYLLSLILNLCSYAIGTLILDHTKIEELLL